MKRSTFLVGALFGGVMSALVLCAQPLPSTIPSVPVQAGQSPTFIDSFLTFDAQMKDYTAKAGEPEAHFTFNLTNISSGNVTINFVQTSCGCTVAKLPSQPWTLTPHEHGQITVTMNLAGKSGTVIKTLNVNTDKGIKMLLVRTTILPPPPQTRTTNRLEMQKIAMADRQAVFKGDCAKCHVQPAKDKMGAELFATACGICHEAEHRATMVPDLHALKDPTDADFWKNWIARGKPGTLMPAFAQSEGGFLTDAQITSLVNYLTQTIPSQPAQMHAAAH